MPRALVLLALVALAPVAAADLEACGGPACVGDVGGDGCGATYGMVDPGGLVSLSASGQDYCGPDGSRARLVEASVGGPEGSTTLAWERGDDYSDLRVDHPPRAASWHDDEHGCAVEVAPGPVEAIVLPCVAGAPPPPPAAPWGDVLP